MKLASVLFRSKHTIQNYHLAYKEALHHYIIKYIVAMKMNKAIQEVKNGRIKLGQVKNEFFVINAQIIAKM